MGNWPAIALTILAAAALSGAAVAHNPPVYKWTDAQGIVHYSDTPPKLIDSGQYLFKLPKLPPVDPREIAAIQARIADINAMLHRIQVQRERELQRWRSQQAAQQPAEETPPAVQLVTAVPVYVGNHRRHHFDRHRYRDRDDFKPVRRSSPKPSPVPTWPFPYNLDHNSSFPEEWHSSPGH